MILEEIIIFVFVVLIEFDGLAVKVSGQIVVLVVNYLISKFITFKRK